LNYIHNFLFTAWVAISLIRKFPLLVKLIMPKASYDYLLDMHEYQF